MSFGISKSAPKPIYQQIADWMIQQIQQENWPEHYQLPNEVELSEKLAVNRGTLRKAIADLRRKGFLVAVHGRGTFVKAKTLEQPLAGHLITFSEDLLMKGITYTTQVLRNEITAIPEDIRQLLGVKGESIFYLHRVRAIQDKPIIVLENYVIPDQLPGIDGIDFTRERLFYVLENTYHIGLDWGWRTFEARIAPTEISRLLKIGKCDPVMYMEQLVYKKDGEPIEYSQVWLRGDSFRLSAQVKRKHEAFESGGSTLDFNE